MKKKIPFSLFLLPLTLLSSCSTSNSLVELERDYSIKEPVSIDGSELQSKINNKEDFLLYIANPGCLSCAAFNEIINRYIENTSAIIYKIFTFQILSSSSIEITTVPEVISYKNGEIKNRTKNLNVYSQFEEFLASNSYLSPKISISEELLEEKITNKDTFIVKYSWDKCSDCNTSNSLFLNEFHQNNKDYTYYEFELSEYYDNRTDSNDPYWLNMTSKFGLSDKGNEEFGWHNGVVPTYQYYEEGVLKDAVVIYNDDYESELDDYGTLKKITITNSYFKDSPYINSSFEATADKNALQIYREKTADYYKQKVIDLFAKLYK